MDLSIREQRRIGGYKISLYRMAINKQVNNFGFIAINLLVFGIAIFENSGFFLNLTVRPVITNIFSVHIRFFWPL